MLDLSHLSCYCLLWRRSDMSVRYSVAALAAAAILAGWAIPSLAAGCNCESTCDTLIGCWEGYENSCHNGECEGWGLFRPDCFFECTWTRYMCLVGGTCDLAVTTTWCTN
jgi:hypothetical protein